ncbi:hypothetical protein MRB53_009212 [Persea americana]|uniref:Uncharacterized protein n=1 Tax=Persea americana TaxID=3435 RepID=A0ACC2LNJ1_PERAE|nr:hypothetical protein MRB53_009212 [Persea americana]
MDSPPSPSPIEASSSTNNGSSEHKGDRSPSVKEMVFGALKSGQWVDVLKKYEENAENIQTASITSSKEKVLHIAISHNRSDVAKKLLGFVANGKVIEEMKNDRDNNPLHLAASLGKADMCEAMMGRGPELIECRNMDGETPLFLAALHGRKEAFYTLRQKWIDIKKEDVSIQHYKRNDGNSILHVTILGEYFDLAFQIIKWYPKLATFRNERGHSPLHILALHPSVFRSGCYLNPMDRFIYRCHISTKCPFTDKPPMLSSPAQSALLKPPSTQATAKPAKDPVVNAKDFQLPEVILVSDPPKQQGPSDPPDPTVAVVASYSHGNFQSSLSLSHSIIASHIPGPNSANDLQHDNPILTLPSDMVYEILGKIPAPALDCSNPFSIPEHCTLAEPTASTSRSMNLIAAQSNIKATTSSPQALQTVTVPTSKSVNSASSLTDISCLPSNIPLDVVAALIATVAFASATTLPGGVNEEQGTPIFEGKAALDIFIISSLVALCFSITSLTMFLSILTSRFQVWDFYYNLPSKLMLGLGSLLASIASILVAFCSGHFLSIRNNLRHAIFPIYAATCLFLTIFVVAQFPLYLDLIRSTMTPVPKRSFEMTSI